MPDRTPLDQLIIEANAIDIAVYTGEPVKGVIARADALWDKQSPAHQDNLRAIYGPTYHRLAAAATEAAADNLDTMHAGPEGAPYVSATKALLRERAQTHRDTAEQE